MGIKSHIRRYFNCRKLQKENKILPPPRLQVLQPQYCHIHSSAILGEECRLLTWDRYNGKPTGYTPSITIGKNFHATRYWTVQCINKVEIGDNVLIASNVTLIDYNHGLDATTDHYLDNPLVASEGIIVKDGAWIGNNCIILGGVTIGKKSIVGAGSVVTKSVPDYSMAVGNPAKVIKRFDRDAKQWVKIEE